jgi:hypothetical protein
MNTKQRLSRRSMLLAVKQEVDEVPSRFTGPAMIQLHPISNLLGAEPICVSQLQPLTYIST